MVDDKPDNLVALEAVLSDPGYHLLSAHSGAEAIELLKKNEVDVILMDIQMPGMDGYEAARQIKRMEHCKNTPIIFISAIFTENPHVKQGYEAGAIDYFTKPFDPEILKMKVAIYASFKQKEVLLREREKQLKESEELLKAGRKLSATLESLPIGVIVADSKGRIIQTNDTVLRIWKSIEPSENDSYGEFLKWWSQDGQLIKEALLYVLKNGQAMHNEILKLKCFDGTLKTVLGSVSPLKGLNDRVVGAVAVIQDITEHKKIEKDMEQRILHFISLGLELEQQVP